MAKQLNCADVGFECGAQTEFVEFADGVRPDEIAADFVAREVRLVDEDDVEPATRHDGGGDGAGGAGPYQDRVAVPHGQGTGARSATTPQTKPPRIVDPASRAFT